MILVSRPSLAIAAFLMAGIISGRYFQPEFTHCLYALAVSGIFLSFRRTRMPAIAVALLVLGSTLYVARYRIASPDDLRLVLSAEPALVTVRGKLVESPEVREFQSGQREIAYSYATLDVSELQPNKSEWRPATGRVATRLRGELSPEFFRGRTVEITGVIAFPAKAAAPGLFDYRAYLHNTRIFYQLKSDSTDDWRLLSFEPMPLTERFRRWAAVQLQRGIPERDEASEIIAAMTLGLRNSMSGEMSDVFMRTGTLHIIAISGLHVACIACFFSFALRVLGFPRAVEGLMIIAVVWFYTGATGFQSSAARSALMATIFMLVWIVHRPSELLNTVAASAAIILVIQPEQLFQASFQLSFSVVFVIALIANFIERHHPNARMRLSHQVLKIDPLLPYELVPRWKKIAKWAFGFAIANLIVSAASWIGSTPLTAYYFNTVTPISLVANLVAVPLSSVSLGATVVSILIPPVAPISNFIAWLFMKATINVAEFFASFSFGYFYVPRPNALFMLAYAALVAVLFIPQLRAGLRKVSSALVIAILSLFWLGSLYAAKPIASLTILPCAGTPVFVEEPRRIELLIDCSSDRDADFMLKRFLRAQGLGSIDALLLTHGDAQMVGGFPIIWTEFSPKTVFTSPARMRSPGYKRAIQFLENHPDRWTTIGAGDELSGWRVLHPPRNERAFPRADDNAVVLRKKIGRWTILHLSDLGPAGQKELLESEIDLRADLVIAGLPEQGEPLSDDLLEAIQPQVIILGTATFPYTAQGTPKLRDRLEATGAKVFYLHSDAAVTVSIRSNECAIFSMENKSVSLRNRSGNSPP